MNISHYYYYYYCYHVFLLPFTNIYGASIVCQALLWMFWRHQLSSMSWVISAMAKENAEQSQSGEKITALRRVVVTEKVTFEQHPST